MKQMFLSALSNDQIGTHFVDCNLYQTICCVPAGRGLYNKDRSGLITVMLACQAMRMYKPGVGYTQIHNYNEWVQKG